MKIEGGDIVCGCWREREGCGMRRERYEFVVVVCWCNVFD